MPYNPSPAIADFKKLGEKFRRRPIPLGRDMQAAIFQQPKDWPDSFSGT